MARIDHSFAMQEQSADAQARFQEEIGPALHRLGFQQWSAMPEHLEYSVRYMTLFGSAQSTGVTVLLWLLFPLWLWFTVAIWLFRLLMGQRVEMDFDTGETGTRVDVYGKAPRGIVDMIEV